MFLKNLFSKKEETCQTANISEMFSWQGANKEKKSKESRDFYSQNFDCLRTAIAYGSKIEGKLSFNTPVKIEGQLVGTVFSSDDLIIGPNAVMEGDLKAKNIIIFGKVTGQITTSEKIILLGNARVFADANCKAISFADGTSYNGKCAMQENGRAQVSLYA